MSIIEGSSLALLLPKDFIIPVGIKRRIDVNEIYTGVGKPLELIKVIATIHDLCIYQS